MNRMLWLLALAACHHDPAAAPVTDPGELRAVAAGAHTVGTPAPAMTVTTIDGQALDLGAMYGGKPVYFKFWATWCVPCKEQMPRFEQAFERLGDRIQFVAVNAGIDDDLDSVRAIRSRFGLRMPIVVDDGRLAAALDLQVTPQHVVIGKDGKVAFVGHQDGDRLDRALQDALAQPAAAVAAKPFALAPALHVGDAVPLRATTIDGQAIELGHPGRPRGLVLFDVYCESYLADKRPATAQACKRVREALQPIAARGDIDWIGISGQVWTDADDVVQYRAEHHIPYPLVFDHDGALFHALGVHDVPTVILLDAEGKIARVVGPDDRDLDGAIRAVTLR